MTAPKDFETSLGYWVFMTSMAFRRAMNEELAPLGLTHRQSQVVCWLKHEENISQARLACLMDIEPPTLAGILDRMELAGWLKRVSCREDRRKKLLQLEPAAEPVWEQIAACAERVREVATRGISTDEATQVMSALRRVNDNLSRRDPGSSSESQSSCLSDLGETN